MHILHRTNKVMQLRARPPTLLEFTLQTTKYMIEPVFYGRPAPSLGYSVLTHYQSPCR
jgi:hypothetical protein